MHKRILVCFLRPTVYICKIRRSPTIVVLMDFRQSDSQQRSGQEHLDSPACAVCLNNRRGILGCEANFTRTASYQ